MSKDEIALILFLYTLVILIGSSRSFLGQITASGWGKDLELKLQEPISTSAHSTFGSPRVSRSQIAKAKIIHHEKRA
jgi:hypothetical protein